MNRRRVAYLIGLVLFSVLLSGCGSIFGRKAAPTPTPDLARVAVPTFTPTPAVAQQPTATPVPVQPATEATTAPAEQVAPTVASQPPAEPPTATPAPAPQLTITGPAVNIRSGPGTEYGIVGAASQGESFDLTGKNPAGDWWRVCCVNGQPGWVFGQLASVENVESVAVAADIPAPPTPAPVAIAPTAAPEAPVEDPAEAPAAPYDPTASSGGNFDPNAQYQIVHFKVLGKDENNGGIRSSSAQHLIFLTVLDENGNGVDGAVVKNLVGEHGEVVTGSKGPGKAELTMYWEPFKLTVASDPSGPVTSQVSNQMGLAFPHLPDLVGKLGDENYEYAVCPTIDIKCQWPIQAVHFSYEITFQKVK